MSQASEAPASSAGYPANVTTGRISVTDWVVTVTVTAALLITGLSGAPATGLDLLGYLLLVACGLALVAGGGLGRWCWPSPDCARLGYQAAGFDVFAVAYLVAVYAAVRAGHRVAAVVAASVLMLAALPLATGRLEFARWARRSHRPGASSLAWLIAAGAAGEALRQAERRADEAERTREETALRRADEERLHIARELHDSLTHQISVIKVQAEAAVHLAQKRGEPVPESLLAIRDAGREAARELRATLEALRDDDDTRAAGSTTSGPGAAGPNGRPGRVLTIEGHRSERSGRGGPDRLPDRAGVADQHRPARRRRDRVGPDRVPPRRGGHPGR